MSLWITTNDILGSGGLKLDANGRAALMARLSESAGMTAPKSTGASTVNKNMSAPSNGAPQVASLPTQGLLGPASPIPSQCILLKNLFRPEEYVYTID